MSPKKHRFQGQDMRIVHLQGCLPIQRGLDSVGEIMGNLQKISVNCSLSGSSWLIHDCLRSLGRTSLMKGFLAITDSESKACAMFSNPSSIKALTVRVEWLIQSCWRWMVCWYSSSWKKKLLVDDMLMIIGSPYVVLPVIYRYIGD